MRLGEVMKLGENYLYKCAECSSVNFCTEYYGPVMQNVTCAGCEVSTDRYFVKGYAIEDENGNVEIVFICPKELEGK